MPILSNLSRRFHMLTTDAKPDPPRIGANGYTHNSNSTNENKDTKAECTSNGSEQQLEQSYKTTESLTNTVVATNTPYSDSEKHFDEPDSFTTNAKHEKKSNAKTKAKSKQYRHSQGAHVINYNIVNSNGVKLGSRTTYICNINHFSPKNETPQEDSWSKSELRPRPVEVERLCDSTEELTLDDIFIIKTHIGRGWKDVARKLLYSDGQIEQFEENYRFQGISEIVYQIFIDWKQASTKDAQIGRLINILWDCQEYDCAKRLVSSRKNSV